MKKKLSILLAAVLMAGCLPASVSAKGEEDMEKQAGSIVKETYDKGGYQVYLPAGYDDACNYPSVYIMPYDGYHSQTYIDDEIAETLNEIMAGEDCVDMVVIMPDFEEGDDYRSMLDSLVEDVTEKYAVIDDSSYRAVCGANVGGYMAYETALISESDSFYAVGSYMGDFTSEDNPYVGEYGAVIDVVNNLDSTPKKGYETLSKHYYYLDAPNGDSSSTVAGGTSDIGAGLEKRTNPYWQYGGSTYLYSTPDLSMVEYAILDGVTGTDFYMNSISRSFQRFSTRFTEKLYTGSLTCTPQAVTASDSTIEAEVKLTVSEEVLSYAESVPDIQVILSMSDPDSGKELYSTSGTLQNLTVGEENSCTFKLDRSQMAPGINTTVTADISFLGMTRQLAELSLVSVQETGTADDEQQIDLMGNWHFKAYKSYKKNDTSVVELDRAENITEDVYKEWGIVQPGLGWWTSDFDSSLGNNDNYSGYAWYVRNFDVPEDFPKEGLIMAAGYFDEANEVYINGIRVGSTGMDYTIADGIGVYDGSNPWDTNCVYELDSSVLNYGGDNVIAVRMCNSSGGGGWYEGPIGIYSKAAYNKAAGLPSVYAPENVTGAVLELAEKQQTAIETENLEEYKQTLSPDYFESGYDKERQTEKITGLTEQYSDIEITDKNAAVFCDGELYNYQAVRLMTGINSEGVQTEIFSGEVSEYYEVNDGNVKMCGSHSRFFEDTYVSEALGGTEQTFRIYLPEGYFESGQAERYRTLYLFHGINSTSKTYEIDGIDKVLDQAIAEGQLEKMIVVIPDDPTKSSFWKDEYADMVTDDLLPTVDRRYRTIDDARYRFTAGCSMGGAGSVNIGLFNPNLFSGTISFYGALNYVNALENIREVSSEYLQQYSIYMACGNQDMYNFYEVQEQVSRLLSEKGVDHYHYVDIGTHSTSFYLPLFVDSLQYIQERMYSSDGAEKVMSGEASVKEKKDSVTVDYKVNISDDVSTWLDHVVDSVYTDETDPALQIPVQIVLEQEGRTISSTTEYGSVREAAELTGNVELRSEDIDMTKDYTVSVYASVLENTETIQRVTVEKNEEDKPQQPDDSSDQGEADQPGSSDKPEGSDQNGESGESQDNAESNHGDEIKDAVQTGDTADVTVWAVLILMSSICTAVFIKTRKKNK